MFTNLTLILSPFFHTLPPPIFSHPSPYVSASFSLTLLLPHLIFSSTPLSTCQPTLISSPSVHVPFTPYKPLLNILCHTTPNSGDDGPRYNTTKPISKSASFQFNKSGSFSLRTINFTPHFAHIILVSLLYMIHSLRHHIFV